MNDDGNQATAIKMLVLGGCRSGKSRFAEQWLASRFTRKVFIATMRPSDDPEVGRRIALHRRERDERWLTVEEPLDLVAALARPPVNGAEAVLIDCLTLWISNFLLHGLDDRAIEEEVRNLARAVRAAEQSVVLVANEVGLGVVPEHPLGRRFRDLAGWTNQRLAEVCQPVLFLAAGLPLVLKGEMP